jgi:hypothetical protein
MLGNDHAPDANAAMTNADNLERGEYLIDGFRVTYLHQAEWRCACREFTTTRTCRHAREASGMREAQVLIRRRLLARVSDFLPHVRGLSVARSGSQPNRRVFGRDEESAQDRGREAAATPEARQRVPARTRHRNLSLPTDRARFQQTYLNNVGRKARLVSGTRTD